MGQKFSSIKSKKVSQGEVYRRLLIESSVSHWTLGGPTRPEGNPPPFWTKRSALQLAAVCPSLLSLSICLEGSWTAVGREMRDCKYGMMH